ncbi:MAG: DegT/DnrJ/EryC1/StrS family aminotransferase [Theionarchaea archaeon]|nr:DegT/DnrJ/EryC1/StrS family aminotransferase [Theionarchaea archaeon]
MIPIATPRIGEEELEALKKVLESGWLTNGPTVEQFEKDFSSYIGVEHGVSVNSGTSALLCALLAGKIKGEVITTAFSFISSVSTILFAQCTPVFVDIKEDFNIDEEKIAEKITSKTKALLPVHLYGNPCTMKALIELAEDHNLLLLEDACQAHGAEYKGKKVGGFGTGCFSFYPTKNMTTAEGGMVVTDDPEIARRCRLLRNIGQTTQYEYEFLGYNFRMSELSAALGCAQLKKLDGFNDIRIKNANYLTRTLNVQGIEPPGRDPEKKHVYHQYTVRVCEPFPLTRDELQQHLITKGIGCRVYYPTPLHHLPFFAPFAHKDLKRTEESALQVLSLPVHPGVSHKELDYIRQTIGDAE